MTTSILILNSVGLKVICLIIYAHNALNLQKVDSSNNLFRQEIIRLTGYILLSYYFTYIIHTTFGTCYSVLTLY